MVHKKDIVRTSKQGINIKKEISKAPQPEVKVKQESIEDSKFGFAFSRINYILLLIGFIVIVIGFLLMLGGGSEDPTVFNADEIFSTRRIVIAPMVVLAGFIFEIYAIMKKPKEV